MSRVTTVPVAKNEPVNSYAPGTPERAALKAEIEKLRSEVIDIPMYIDGKEVRTGNLVEIHPPHDLGHLLGHHHKGEEKHVQQAIDAALKAKEKWAAMDWKHRAAIFLKAASLVSGKYRYKINAATMLGQSKTAHQAEIDAACELADFLRFNVQFMEEIYNEQPLSFDHTWNTLQQRPLEGFVFALTPFNFTAIGGNLPTAPAMMGNVVVWKASNTQIYSARVFMEILLEAGLPDGVINLVYVSGPVAGNVIFNHKDFAGIHYTGSTSVFNNIWQQIGNNINNYKSYPRIVGETGGKDFVIAHSSAIPEQVGTALVRGAFEFQGQKCSAASRAYIPKSIWGEVQKTMKSQISQIKMGGVEDFGNFFSAVIDKASFDKISKYISDAKESNQAEVIMGGKCDDSKGYFIEPTVIEAKDPKYVTMVEEIFGPVLTVYVYEDEKFEETLELLDSTSEYALTGAIFSKEREAVILASKKLENSAGNFYINDKPTGAVVGHQPFGGARGSGTNDKAGSKLNLFRWVSPRTIKECFLSPTDFKYPFMGKE